MADDNGEASGRMGSGQSAHSDEWTRRDPQSGNDKAKSTAEDELETAKMYIDLLQKQLAKAQDTARKAARAAADSLQMERERDRYRATVLSLAYQNKVLQSELGKTRQSTSSKEERYYDARLQIADLKEVLAASQREIEELKAARDYLPTSDTELLAAYRDMREVFESLRSTLSCSLCYEIFKPGDVLTLECGHTMCNTCLSEWNVRHIRLYNLNTTPDCPECRAPGRHFVKVYMLEEAVRTVDRLAVREAEREALRQAERKLATEAETAQKQDQPMHIEEAGDLVNPDEVSGMGEVSEPDVQNVQQ